MYDDNIFIFACQWRDKFYPLEIDNIELYYFSLYINDSPVYRIMDWRTKRNFDIYRHHSGWRIAEKFNYRYHLDSSSFNNEISKLIPPKYGWKSDFFKEIMEKVIGLYHSKLSNFHPDFFYWKPKYIELLNKKQRKFIINFLLIKNRYKIVVDIPLEMVWMILNFFKLGEI